MAVINQVGNNLTGQTGSGAFVGANSPTLVLPKANNFISGYTTTATAAGTTTLTVDSTYQQFFTGATTQNVDMPVTSTLTVGQSWLIINNSTGIVTVRSSGGNTIIALPSGTNSLVTCIAQAGTTASDWNAEGVSGVAGVDSITGTANQVIASASTGAVTLSLPQNINSGAAPVFAATNFTGLPVVQMKYTQVTGYQSGSTAMALSTVAVPTNTQGDQYFSLTITPKSATNILRFEAIVNICSGTSADIITMALFQDSTVNSLACSWGSTAVGNIPPSPQVLRFNMVAGTTSSTTFKIRIGSNTGGVTQINGASGTAYWPGALLSSFQIIEFTP